MSIVSDSENLGKNNAGLQQRVYNGQGDRRERLTDFIASQNVSEKPSRLEGVRGAMETLPNLPKVVGHEMDKNIRI